MRKENKELLLKDLCARVPYGVKVNVTLIPQEEYKHQSFNAKIVCVDVDYIGVLSDNSFLLQQDITEIRPYLYPLSSMTEEQQKDLAKFVANGIYDENIVYDWYNKNHFDYRGLINKGLAIDVTNLNVY